MKACALTLAAITTLFASVEAASEITIPWAYYSRPRSGYTIRLDALKPLAGSPLLQGQTTTITMTFSYTLETAPKGVITLEFLDHRDRDFLGDRPQVTHEVFKDGGPVTLSDTFVIPTKAKEIWLIVRLQPEGMRKRTGGDVLIRWPVWVPVPSK